MPFCPRHKQDVDIYSSRAMHKPDENGVPRAVTVHELMCGETETLKSGKEVFDRCAFTAPEMSEALAARRKELADAASAAMIAEAEKVAKTEKDSGK